MGVIEKPKRQIRHSKSKSSRSVLKICRTTSPGSPSSKRTTMALSLKLSSLRLFAPTATRSLSSTSHCSQRFGSGDGSSGWKWEKGGVGMGGKDSAKATEVKETVGKTKDYKVPEFFGYNAYSYFDVEKDMAKQRNPQPKSGATEFW